MHASTTTTDPGTPPGPLLGTDADLEARIRDLTARMAAGTYELLILVAEYDTRRLWADQGALSCAHWLAGLCDIEISTARTQVRVAHALVEHPGLDAAMARGDISYAKARVLVAHLTADNAAELIAIATRTSAGRLGTAIATWSRRNEDPEIIDRRHHDQRSTSWNTDPDGMVTLTARMTPHAAALICAVIDHHLHPGAPAGASDPSRTDRPDTLAQQRHDALHRALSTGSGAVDTEVVIHVREDGNTLTDGTPVADHAVAGLLPDAFVSLLVHDRNRTPIDASPRRRAPTRRQRRVIDELHPECAHPGCHARVFLQYDHITRYTDGGPTTIDNTQRLCGPHNRAKEAREAAA